MHAGQADRELGEFAGSAIDLDRAAVLLGESMLSSMRSLWKSMTHLGPANDERVHLRDPRRRGLLV